MTQSDKESRREYRRRLGLTSQESAKGFFAARDLPSEVDLAHVSLLASRVEEIVSKLNGEMHPSVRWEDMTAFCNQFVKTPASKIVSSGLINSMKNQGRRPEQVFFSWLRGYSLLEFFTPALAHIFGVQIKNITKIGDDDLSKPETFRRTARADLELDLSSVLTRVEVQTGLQGVNDIKSHKVKEAHSAWTRRGIATVCAHFDIYNGRAALVPLHEIPAKGPDWITRPQMEGQDVLPIAASHFRWDFNSPPPRWPSAWEEAQ